MNRHHTSPFVLLRRAALVCALSSALFARAASAQSDTPAPSEAPETALATTNSNAPAPVIAAQLSKPPPPGFMFDEPEALPPSSTIPRLELSLLSVPLGGGAGALFCGLAECRDGRRWAASVLLGSSAGVALSALVTRKTGLEFSTAQAIEGGAFWGTTTSIYFWLIASRSHEQRPLLAGMATAELLGAGLGGLLERRLRPTSGAVALANSGSLWLSAITVLTAFAIKPVETEAGARGMGGGLLGAQILGLGLGGLLGQRFGASRAQVWLSDMGAVVLGGTLPLLTWLFMGYDFPPAALLGSTAVGMGLGFAGAYMLAELLPSKQRRAVERVSHKLAGVQLAMMPVRSGGGVTFSKPLR